jgi:hypothetical protein
MTGPLHGRLELAGHKRLFLISNVGIFIGPTLRTILCCAALLVTPWARPDMVAVAHGLGGWSEMVVSLANDEASDQNPVHHAEDLLSSLFLFHARNPSVSTAIASVLSSRPAFSLATLKHQSFPRSTLTSTHSSLRDDARRERRELPVAIKSFVFTQPTL